jgi:hypothetical protein
MRIAVVPLLILLAGCASTDVSGPYANRLSAADVREIKTHITADSRLISPWIHITAIEPNRVQLENGGLTSSDGMTIDGDSSTKIFLVKRGDKWEFDMTFGVEGSRKITVY